MAVPAAPLRRGRGAAGGSPPTTIELSLDADNDFVLSYRGPLAAVPAGGKHTFTETLFVGPKLQEQLAQAGPRLELVADYGKLTIIAQPLFTVLEFVYGVIGNWGWAIIIVTFLIKLAFYKLTASSGRSMAKMRNLGPRIKAIQERYKDDREQLGRQMMEIYKREKINPLAGCLPILIQIPFFLAFYWVLLESVEMRQAPFLGWITDLSSRDPYLHSAHPDGGRDVRAVQAAADAQHRSGAGEDLHVHAAHHVGDHGVVPGGPGAVLADQHLAVDRAAVPDQQAGRGGRSERERPELTRSTRRMTTRPGDTDTIAAIATPPGRGGVGMVRISGRARPDHRCRSARGSSRAAPRSPCASFVTPTAKCSTAASPSISPRRIHSPAKMFWSCMVTADPSSWTCCSPDVARPRRARRAAWRIHAARIPE